MHAQGKEETQIGCKESFYTSNWSWLWGDDNHTWVGLSHAKAGWRPPHKYWQSPCEWILVRSGTRPSVLSAGKSNMLFFAPLTMRIREGWHQDNASRWRVECEEVFHSSDRGRESWFWPQRKWKPREYGGRRASRTLIVESIKRTGAHR